MTRPSLVVPLLLCGLAAAACRRAPAPAGRPVRMACLQNDVHHLALWVALDEGFFRSEGVEVEVAGAFRAGAELMSAFGSGGLDMAYVGQAPVTIAVARGAAQVQVVALVNAEGSALVVRRDDASIRGVADLRGRVVAMPGLGSVQDVLLRKALLGAGLGPDDAKVVVVKPPEMLSALQSRQIDAFLAWEPYPAKAATLGIGRTLEASRAIWAGHPCCVLVASDAFAAAHRAEVDAVVRAHARATAFIHEHPDQAVAVAVRHTGLDAATVREALGGVSYSPRLSRGAEEELVRSLVRLDYIPAGDPAAFVDRLVGGRTEVLAP
jgi:NitT/TauT family transport system substrate-binding protein